MTWCDVIWWCVMLSLYAITLYGMLRNYEMMVSWTCWVVGWRYMMLHDVHGTGVCGERILLLKRWHVERSPQSTKSGAGEQFLLLFCRAEARAKGVFLFTGMVRYSAISCHIAAHLINIGYATLQPIWLMMCSRSTLRPIWYGRVRYGAISCHICDIKNWEW